MKKILLICIMLQITLGINAQNSDKLDNSIIVKLKPVNNNKKLSPAEKLSQGQLNVLSSNYPTSKVMPTGVRKNEDTYAIYFSESQNIDAVILDYKETGLFEYVEPNFKGTGAGQSFELPRALPNDNAFNLQWGLNNDGSFPLGNPEEGVDIKMEQAWDIEQGDETIIAVIDSGVKIDHPELAGRLWTNEAEILDGIDNDNNGYIDDIDGWNFAYNNNNLSDDVGHGSNIAGVIAANPNNGVGFAGINWNCKIMNVKMLNANNAYLDGAWAINAVQYAVDQGAKIINMSWGSSFNSSALNDVIQLAHSNGIVLTAAMMNTDNNVLYYPAAYPEVIAVGAIDPDGDRSSPFPWSVTSGSNFGSHIDVVAPGNYTVNITHNSDTNFSSYWAGTSQAAPHVAGVASLMLAQNPSLTPEQIRTILKDTADDLTGDPSEDTAGFDIYYGSGRLNAFAALSSVLNVEEYVFNSISIFPNPADVNRDISVKFGSLFSGQINIYSPTGARVFDKALDNVTLETNLNISHLNNGLYLVEFRGSNNEKSIVKKLLVNN